MLDFDQRIVRLQGEAEFNVFELLQLDGVFEIKLTDEEFTLFVDAHAKIGPEGFELEADAQFLLIANADGFGIRAELSDLQLEIGPVVRLEIETLELIVFAGTDDLVYEVPPEFRERLGGVQTITISEVPPGQTAPVNFYMSLEGQGSLSLLSLLDMEGEFSFLFSEDDIKLSVGMAVQLPLLKAGIQAVGTVGVKTGNDGEAGLYGSLQIGAPGTPLLEAGPLTLSGFFLLQVNTTSSKQTVRGYKLDAERHAEIRRQLDERDGHTEVAYDEAAVLEGLTGEPGGHSSVDRR
jgi:hypothetical protein